MASAIVRLSTNSKSQIELDRKVLSQSPAVPRYLCGGKKVVDVRLKLEAITPDLSEVFCIRKKRSLQSNRMAEASARDTMLKQEMEDRGTASASILGVDDLDRLILWRCKPQTVATR